MKSKFALVIIFLTTAIISAKAQTFEVPKGYILKAKTDYAQYEGDVLKCIDWLQQTSWTDDVEKRSEANTFLVAWVTGSPDITMEVPDSVMNLCELNKELLFSFIGGYTKYALTNKTETDRSKPFAAGLKALIQKYQSEKVYVKDEAIEDLIRVEKEGKLKDWIVKASMR